MSRREQRRREAVTSTTPCRILVVDDDDGVRQTVAELLSYEGYEVNTAKDGAEGLRQLHKGPLPDAIILDLMMPNVDGWAFREAQLAGGARAVPTIIFSAARASLPPRREGLEGYAFLSKPFDIDRLLEVVSAAVHS
jgi:CheY-like chemotaxis protein